MPAAPAAASPAPGPSLFDALSLASAAADELLLGAARDTHGAISKRLHGTVRLGLGPLGAAPEVLHRGIATAVYSSIGLALRGSSRGFDRLAAADLGPRLEETPRGRFVSSAVNGLIGDELLRDRPQLAIPLAVRHEGRNVDLHDGGAALVEAFPDATGRLVVFLHGLCENESYWRLHRERTGRTYGEALADRGWTPVYLRANTGLPVRENGAALASLMQRLVDAWPTEVTRIALVGHSMGGLILRAGCAVMAAPDVSSGVPAGYWTDLVTDVVTLCTPHYGAPIAWGIGHGSRLMAMLPETSAIGRILDKRSEGVRDLVSGLADDVPPLPHGRYRLVAATLTESPRHPVGSLVGDLLVRPRSASGRDRRGRELFPGADVLHVGGTDHFGVLNHPDVLAALHRWLS